MAKSYRTAFIRVTSENETMNGIVSYSSSDIEKTLVNWSKSTKMTYWFIQHDEDEDEDKVHFHIVIKFNSPVQFQTIKNKFQYGKIENAKNLKNVIQYLVHLNNPEKKQYSWDAIVTNGELEQYKQVSNSVTLKSIIADIDKGLITEYNLQNIVSMEMYVFYKQKIDNAFKYYRERESMNKNRDIDVILMVGNASTGKTTFAKRYCEKTHSTYGISSASNDSIQDYKGENVFILDDLRDDSFEFHNLLKMLDNHTNSSVKSRYSNKMFFGKTIIITSTVPIEEWYKDLRKEDKKQLLRRIKSKYVFDDEWIHIYEYDERKGYVLIGRTENIITLEDKRRKTQTFKVFEDMGLKIQKMNDEGVDNESFHKHVDDPSQTKFNF